MTSAKIQDRGTSALSCQVTRTLGVLYPTPYCKHHFFPLPFLLSDIGLQGQNLWWEQSLLIPPRCWEIFFLVRNSISLWPCLWGFWTAWRQDLACSAQSPGWLELQLQPLWFFFWRGISVRKGRSQQGTDVCRGKKHQIRDSQRPPSLSPGAPK